MKICFTNDEQIIPKQQGEPGAFSEAAIRYVLGDQVDAMGYNTFEEAFKAVSNETCDVAFIPIENTLGGSIHSNYDLLLRYNLFIIGETNFHVQHCLLVCTETDPNNIKRVFSHFQALAQCDDYLRKHGYTPEPFHDTAGSAKYLSEKRFPDAASVASALAAERYGLKIVEKGIQDDKENFTRFIILSRRSHVPPPNVPAKTSIVFSLVEQVGALVKALTVFSLRDIDLTKIENRPGRKHLLGFSDSTDENALHNTITLNNKLREHHKETVQFKEKWNLLYHNVLPTSTSKQPYQVLFYLDFSASISDIRALNSLMHLSEMAPFVRVLGSYQNINDISSESDGNAWYKFVFDTQ